MFRHAQLESVKAWIVAPANSALPLHIRIQRAIRQMILDRVLEAGRPLPASRALATSLGVSRDTVESAYGQLHAEGFIERRVGSGSFVSERAYHRPVRERAVHPADPAEAPHPAHPAETPHLSERGHAMFRTGGIRRMPVTRPFAAGAPDARSFPIATWERLERQMLKEHGARALLYSAPQGVEPLRQVIADYVNLERGANATPDRVLVLTSSQQALSLCAHVLLDPGERILVEDPGYHGARKAFEAAGLVCVPIPVDGDGLQLEPLKQAVSGPGGAPRAIFLTPSHQFPTGATLSLDRRLGIIEWAWQHGSWIIEDDYDSEFHYAGKPTACVQGLDPHQRTIYVGTFTKSLFPGLRIGYMVLPPSLVEPMTVARTLQDGHNATVPQLTLARFIEGGHYGAYVRSMRAVYAGRRDQLAQLVHTYLGEVMEPQVPTGGLQMPCLFVRDLPEQAIVDAALREGIDLLGLTDLHIEQPPQAGLLMGFASHAPHEMEAAIRKLARVIESVTGIAPGTATGAKGAGKAGRKAAGTHPAGHGPANRPQPGEPLPAAAAPGGRIRAANT
ncbi:PLP-dependent aminotransferase family protein [Phaeovibrio sulfidiphilus]|uniref:PLP-dependent aminotransferase family protein n=1 Tax=Phaeovibrio sulfidiphilus TaxID=1220600 RepID=A0A8J6YKY0_9PROT|nr:PLP-dependent aminotransferase family protein [Phaeovibrio sulfidiphilus]MBE1236550.1 PLP-dependent aminotransferase family protein [Phaeovibrio sulfidiphilus]